MSNINLSHQLKSRIKTILGHPSTAFLRSWYAGQGSCLLYHRITPGSQASCDNHYPSRGLAVSEETFEEQISFLKQNYNCLDISTAVELLSKGKLPKRTVIITFDDGYRDNLTLGLPVLEKYGVPATIYITTGFIDRTANLWWLEQEYIVHRLTQLKFELGGSFYHWNLKRLEGKYQAISELNKAFRKMDLESQNKHLVRLRNTIPEKYSYDDIVLDWSEVLSLDKHPLITIGAHTVNHPALSRLSDEHMKKEMLESKQTLEDKLGHSVEHFAYPYGLPQDAHEREYRAAKEVGFKSAVTTTVAHLSQAHAKHLKSIPRVSLDYTDSLPNFMWKLSGVNCMLRNGGRRFAI